MQVGRGFCVCVSVTSGRADRPAFLALSHLNPPLISLCGAGVGHVRRLPTASQRRFDPGVRCRRGTVQTLGVDAEQHGHAVAGPLGDHLRPHTGQLSQVDTAA